MGLCSRTACTCFYCFFFEMFLIFYLALLQAMFLFFGLTKRPLRVS